MPAAAPALVRAFVEVCRLRLGPQDLPASRLLLGLAFGAYAVVSFLIARVDLPAGAALRATAVNLTLEVAFITGLLALRGHAGRVTQTVTALAGTGTLLGAAAWPVLKWLAMARVEGRGAALPGMLWLALFAWSLVVTAHIFRHALDTRYPIAFAVTLLYVWLLLNVNHLLLPVAGGG